MSKQEKRSSPIGRPLLRTKIDFLKTMKNNRQQIANTAAKFLAEGFVQDYHTAKLKALKKLDLEKTVELPTNAEIENALKTHQKSNDTMGDHDRMIRDMREQSLYALKMFEQYNARLVGAVYEGTATKYSPIEIQVYADSPKDMVIKLLDLNIPFDTRDRDVRINKNESCRVPVFHFGAGDYEFEISVHSLNALRQSPLSSISGLPMERASLKKLKKMLGIKN